MLSAKKKTLPYLMWLLPVSFFTFQFVLRLWPGLMMDQMTEQFKVDASDFGILVAYYYLGYSIMQIPCAVMLENYAPKYIIGGSAILCGLSTLMILNTDIWLVACIGRFLIGVGSAVGFLGVSKVVSEWFPREKYSIMIAFSFSIGLLGAVYGGKPVTLLIQKYSWIEVSQVIALVSFVIAASVIVFLKSPKLLDSNVQKENYSYSGFRKVIASKKLWLLLCGNFLMSGVLEGLADVWGVNYIIKKFLIAKEDSAGIISYIFFGMVFGGPLLNLLSKKIGNFRVIAICGILMSILVLVVLGQDSYNETLFICLFFVIGILCCYQVIVFSAGENILPKELLGVGVALINSVNMLGGCFFHSLIGLIMNIYWQGEHGANNIKIYSAVTYEKGLLIVPIMCFIGGSIALYTSFLRKCKTIESE